MLSVAFLFLVISISLCFLALLHSSSHSCGSFMCLLLVVVMPLFLFLVFLALSSTWFSCLRLLSSMFCVRASCVSLLQAVGCRCQLPYMSLIREICGDGTLLYGIEIELPILVGGSIPRRLFFWSSQYLDPVSAYDHAALQAVCCLQFIYGFVILDYSFERLISYATVAQGRHGPSVVNSQLFADVQRLLRSTASVHCYCEICSCKQ